MAAPKGNRFWEARSSHGRKPLFAKPEDLRTACFEYFAWVEENPLYCSEKVAFKGKATLVEIPKMRAMTIGGLCIFLDINPQTWENYKAKEDFFGVTREVENIIKTQKFEGASADLLNANIIARDLGLADKRETTGPNGEPLRIITQGMTAKEAAEAYAASLDSE